MKQIRCGVIGLGWFGEHHVDALQQLPLVEVTAVCTRTESRLREIAAKYKVPKSFTSYKELLADKDIEAVIGLLKGCVDEWLVADIHEPRGASAAYLTVSETFPLEIRALAIAVFYAAGTALGGVAVAAHPYRFWSGIGEAALREAPSPAYETSNARTLRRGNVRARERAREARVGETGGSDSHFLDEAARAVTVFEGEGLSVDEVLQALGQGRTTAQGKDRGVPGTLRYVPKAVSEWMLRGMRRI